MIKARLPIGIKYYSRESLMFYFDNAWQLEDALLKSIINERAFYHNPDKLRNPLIFYLGHCAAFYINKLIGVDLLTNRIDPELEILLSVGVDPATPDELKQSNIDLRWPEVSRVWQYRDRVREVVMGVIEQAPLDFPIHWDHPLWALIMGIEHQRIHFETSSMLLRQLPVNELERPENWQYAPSYGRADENRMIEIGAGEVEFGKPEDSSVYGWDNEYGYRKLKVKAFRVSQYMITNGEFKQFVDDGGYENRDYWDEESWRWKNAYGVKYPRFWLVDEKGDYQYRAMFDVLPLPLDWPVEVNHYEAMAYCRAQGNEVRLMSEAEWNFITFGENKNHLSQDDCKDYNLNLKFCSPSPVGMLSNAKNVYGVYDLRGNVWEWLGDDFNAFKEFKPHHLYRDYSGPYFNSEHKMMLGGAWVTHGIQALAYYRNWFRPNFYQHAGFRIAANI